MTRINLTGFFLTFDTSFKKSLVSAQPITIRTATIEDAESIAKIHVKAWQESYKGIISQAYLDEIPLQDRLDLRKRILSEHNPDSIHLVATINDQIVGFCDAGPAFTESNLFHGEIYAVYLLNEYKHSGIGSTLITSAHTHLTQKKLLPYIAWVLKENISACRFYEKHGGYRFDEELIDIGDRAYPEVAYVFGLQISIRVAKTTDINSMVALSHQKRLAYEKVQPQFWRHALDAENQQITWFNQLIEQDDHLLFVAEANKHIVGFIIGRIRKAPEVYQPGGLTLEIDDFCVESPAQWRIVGNALLHELKTQAKSKGAAQLLVVCGAHDAPKASFLKDNQTMIASEWYVGTIL